MTDIYKEKEYRIGVLKNALSKSDYKAIKYAEGIITEEDYAPIKAKRESLRAQIRTLEEAPVEEPTEEQRHIL